MQDNHFREMFEISPVCLCETDWSEIHQRIEQIRRQGVNDLTAWFEQHPDEVVRCAELLRVRHANTALVELFQAIDLQELLDGVQEILARRDYATFKAHLLGIANGRQRFSSDTQLRTLDGRDKWVEVTSSLSPARRRDWGQVLVSFVDITGRKKLEDRLRTSQKLEAVGKLAGGVAHDFNNLLTGISGFSQLAGEELPADHPVQANLYEIRQLADRATNLTRQLLAFGRRQPLQPVVVNLNAVAHDVIRLLKRLIGEHIELRLAPALDLGNVRADPGQIEQVLINLAVNSRDAMVDGGVLTLQTSNCEAGPGAGEIGDLPPGRYVLLTVTDTGCGMDPATQARIFEPFFSTKQPGQGTGLGLATVYGIVQQHGGHISVSSRLGGGTRFSIYLPRVEEPETPQPKLRRDGGAELVAHGHEMVLVVEDEPTVLDLVRQVLERRGYRVLLADGPERAVHLLARHGKQISLLLTDVVMPQQNGRALYESMCVYYPRLRVLYMSGYADHAVVNDGKLDEDIAFIQKPFTPSAIAQKVREVLDAPPPVHDRLMQTA